MSTTTAQTIAQTVVSDLGSFIAGFLPGVMVVFAGLLALGFGIYLIRKYIIRHKV